MTLARLCNEFDTVQPEEPLDVPVAAPALILARVVHITTALPEGDFRRTLLARYLEQLVTPE